MEERGSKAALTLGIGQAHPFLGEVVIIGSHIRGSRTSASRIHSAACAVTLRQSVP
jgi:hypothetical protein